MRALDDMEDVKALGLSRELTEHTFASSIYCSITSENFDWAIALYPPVERNDLKYFIIYDNVYDKEFNSRSIVVSDKCARISILYPEYIHCHDCSKNEWILNNEEKTYLCKVIEETGWNNLLEAYKQAIESYDDEIEIDISSLPMPDYMQLPE